MEECQIPPLGWACTRGSGHEGPCAAVPKRAAMPHCDARVLHRPGVCRFCDEYSDWQELREVWGINFTGERDPDKLPCPAEMRRDLENIERWPGNRPA